jgi:hypothetical protein
VIYSCTDESITAYRHERIDMNQQDLLALVMYALGKSQPGVSDGQALAIGKQLVSEILALLPPPTPVP